LELSNTEFSLKSKKPSLDSTESRYDAYQVITEAIPYLPHFTDEIVVITDKARRCLKQSTYALTNIYYCVTTNSK